MFLLPGVSNADISLLNNTIIKKRNLSNKSIYLLLILGAKAVTFNPRIKSVDWN